MNNNIQNKYKNLESNKFQTTAHKSQSYLGYSTKSFFKIKKNNYSSGKLNSITSNKFFLPNPRTHISLVILPSTMSLKVL